MSETRPNIVLVVLDSVRRDHLSCYGHWRRTTPHIDRIAAEGIRFDRAYTTSCWTIPAHASLFTGLYPSEHGADLNTKHLDPRYITLASYLTAKGYTTACVTCNGFLSHETGLNRGFQQTKDVGRLRGGPSGIARVMRGIHRRWRRWTAMDRGAKRATAVSLRWLAERRNGDPFFLFLNYMDCHLPYRLKRPQRFRFADPGDRRRISSVPQDPFAAMAGRINLTEQDLEDLQILYDGSLFYLDEKIGQLDATLRELGLHENTLLIVTSDHGESFGEHGLFDHQYGLYENLISVPLVIRLPLGEKAGTADESFVQHVDLFPTIATLLEDEARLPRLSGLPMFRDPPRERVVAEYLVPNLNAIRRRFPEAPVERFDIAIRSIRVGFKKLIQWRSGENELYDLSIDPAEQNDLAAEQSDVVNLLSEQLLHEVGDWPQNGPLSKPQSDDFAAVRDRLQALGYL